MDCRVKPAPSYTISFLRTSVVGTAFSSGFMVAPSRCRCTLLNLDQPAKYKRGSEGDPSMAFQRFQRPLWTRRHAVRVSSVGSNCSCSLDLLGLCSKLVF